MRVHPGPFYKKYMDMVIPDKTIELLKHNHEWSCLQLNILNEIIAKLYSYELELFKNHWKEENLNTILLENMIWTIAKDDLMSLFKDGILEEIQKLGIKTTFKDLAALHAIYNSYDRHNMHYYLSKGEKLEAELTYERAQFEKLKEVGDGYSSENKDLRKAFNQGRDTYLCLVPLKKPPKAKDCCYMEPNYREAWLNGYQYGMIEDKIYKALRHC